MLSAKDSGLSSWGSIPGHGQCVAFLPGKALTVPLSIQVYRWVWVNLMLGVTL